LRVYLVAMTGRAKTVVGERCGPNRLAAMAFAALAAFCVALPAFATTVRRLGLAEMVPASETIVLGRVEASRSYWQGKQIYTEVTVSVRRTLKGPRNVTLTFVQLGGRVEKPVPLEMVLPGAPIHRVGDEAYFFLQPGRPGERIIVGLFRGHVPLHRDGQGEYILFDGARKVPAGFEEEIRRQMTGQKQDPRGEAQ
jgi:hypothetical protein